MFTPYFTYPFPVFTAKNTLERVEELFFLLNWQNFRKETNRLYKDKELNNIVLWNSKLLTLCYMLVETLTGFL